MLFVQRALLQLVMPVPQNAKSVLLDIRGLFVLKIGRVRNGSDRSSARRSKQTHAHSTQFFVREPQAHTKPTTACGQNKAAITMSSLAKFANPMFYQQAFAAAKTRAHAYYHPLMRNNR